MRIWISIATLGHLPLNTNITIPGIARTTVGYFHTFHYISEIQDVLILSVLVFLVTCMINSSVILVDGTDIVQTTMLLDVELGFILISLD